jgi:hypothetical protein
VTGCAATTARNGVDADDSLRDPRIMQDAAPPPTQGEPAAPAADAKAPADAAPQAAAASHPYRISGSLSSAYRGRWTSGADDQDVYEVLSLDFGDPAHNRWTGHMLGRLSGDLDGNNGGSDPFFNLDDTKSGAVDGRLYDAWGQLNGVGPFEQVRIGRQWNYDTPEVAWFDGVSAETREKGSKRTQFGAYGGIPVRLYESSHTGDQLFGLYAQTHPWKGSRVRADWLHLEDDSLLGKHNDDLLGLDVSQDAGKNLRLEGNYTRLEQHDRDLLLRATWSQAESDLVLQASYYELLHTQFDNALELDPFSTALFEYFPFHEFRLLGSKGVGKHLSLEGGADVRRVEDDSDIGQFNRDFERYYATANLIDSLPAGLGLSATGEIWDSNGSDIRSWGADLSRKWNGGVDGSLGTYYSLFKVDLVSGEERDDVQTYYVKLRWKRKSTRWDLRYEYEDDDPDPFHILRVGMTWLF